MRIRVAAAEPVSPVDAMPIVIAIAIAIAHIWEYSADAPEIEVERPFVHTGVGYETQLVCIVHAEPAPQVIWYKDSTQLGVTEQHSQQVSEERVCVPTTTSSRHVAC